MIVRGDFLVLCDQKSSCQRGFCSQWLWYYRLFLTHSCDPWHHISWSLLYASATEMEGVI